MPKLQYEILRGVDERGNVRSIDEYFARLRSLNERTPLAVRGAARGAGSSGIYIGSGDIFLLLFSHARPVPIVPPKPSYIHVFAQSGSRVFAVTSQLVPRHRPLTLGSSATLASPAAIFLYPHQQVIGGRLERLALNEVAIGRGHDFSCLIPYVLDCVRHSIPVDEGVSTDVALITGGDALAVGREHR